jgi:hypothetical protein
MLDKGQVLQPFVPALNDYPATVVKLLAGLVDLCLVDYRLEPA